MSGKFDLFDSLEARESPLDKPEGGTLYVYKWQICDVLQLCCDSLFACFCV